ncbi:sodium/calcium exchanger NCL-like [Humulus lupulus]|uniref:sodium/calcium exchanger NCL-like n=1 Tax=Humulus lupulus TaxID=3486 RepID=UPI002B405391|nr:sodium/calcium exchanger NCL-like [Humulus lupulus]
MFNKAQSFVFLFSLFLILCGPVHCSRVISDQSVVDLVSDGVDFREKEPSYLRLNNPLTSSFSAAEAESTCEQSYGFLPCTTTALGNLFLILVYGFLMFTSATYLSNGSELLLEILGPGLIGGLFLPILGALPDAMLILVSGLSGTTEVAQSQVSVGMGLLAGSTVMLLTVIWGTCIVVGKCDIENSVAKDSTDTKGFSLTGSGVSTDIWTSYAAMIMAVSVIPFLIVQLPQLLSSTSGRHLAVLIGLIASVLLLISYCLYQVFQPWIQRRRLDYAKHKHVISGILKHLKTSRRLLTEDGEPDVDVISKLFDKIDADNDGELSTSEIRALIIGINFDEIDLDSDEAANKVMADFDTSNNSRVDKKEFINGISRWLNEANQTKRSGNASSDPLDEFHEQTKKDLLGGHDQSDEVLEGVENAKIIIVKAVLYLLLGTAIAAAFADPLVDAVDNFSSATSIPKFFISFIALPLATNSSEAVSAIIFATRKKKRTSSLTFSAIYGAVTMNNVLCLSVFLALVYVRGLTWDFSSEVLIIFIVCTIMGLFGSLQTTFPLWMASIAFLLYPFSLALVYVLDYFFGWS